MVTVSIKKTDTGDIVRVHVTHQGFVRGKPQRYRHVGEMPVLLETCLEIRSVSERDAPDVYRRFKAYSKVGTYKFHDGHFYRRSAQEKLKAARHGTISVEKLQKDTPSIRYSTRCGWKSFSDNAVGRGEPRLLDNWKATEMDNSKLPVFEAAVRSVADDYMVVGTSLWERCFEPCLVVQWAVDRTAGAIHVWTGIDHVGDPHGVLDSPEWNGASPYPSFNGGRLLHRRCFSAKEAARMETFISGLTSPFATSRVSRDLGDELAVETPGLASDDFDDIELRRSAKTVKEAYHGMMRAIRKNNRRRHGLRPDISAQLEHGVARVGQAWDEYAAGRVSPEQLLETIDLAIAAFEQATEHASTSLGMDLHAFVPPPYFGNLDTFEINLDITGSPSGLRP